MPVKLRTQDQTSKPQPNQDVQDLDSIVVRLQPAMRVAVQPKINRLRVALDGSARVAIETLTKERDDAMQGREHLEKRVDRAERDHGVAVDTLASFRAAVATILRSDEKPAAKLSALASLVEPADGDDVDDGR